MLLQLGFEERMVIQFVLSEYIDAALEQAEYEKLEEGSYSGCIPVCPGVIAFANGLRECERQLRSTLEDWLLLGLRLGHALPVVAGIDLNKEATYAASPDLNSLGGVASGH